MELSLELVEAGRVAVGCRDDDWMGGSLEGALEGGHHGGRWLRVTLTDDDLLGQK